MFDILGIAQVSRRLIMKYVFSTMKGMLSDNSSRNKYMEQYLRKYRVLSTYSFPCARITLSILIRAMRW